MASWITLPPKPVACRQHLLSLSPHSLAHSAFHSSFSQQSHSGLLPTHMADDKHAKLHQDVSLTPTPSPHIAVVTKSGHIAVDILAVRVSLPSCQSLPRAEGIRSWNSWRLTSVASGLRWCEIGLSPLHSWPVSYVPLRLFSHSAFKEAADADSRGPLFFFHVYPGSSSSILLKKGIEGRSSNIASL